MSPCVVVWMCCDERTDERPKSHVEIYSENKAKSKFRVQKKRVRAHALLPCCSETMIRQGGGRQLQIVICVCVLCIYVYARDEIRGCVQE